MKYTSIARLRAEGVTGVQATDKRVRDSIAIASRRINTITEQYFTPIQRETRLSGRGTPSLMYDNLIPVVRVNSISEIVGGVASEISSADYVANGRLIQAPDSTFAEGSLNFLVDGITGWLEETIEFTASTTEVVSASSSSAEITIPLSKTMGLVEGSILLLPDGRSLFVNSVNYAANTITIDAYDFYAGIDSGVTVECFGSVPSEIQRACCILANRAIPQVASSAYDDLEFTAQIKSERVDDYSYTLFSAAELSGQSAQQSTGSIEADSILYTYSKPLLPIMV